MSIKITTLVENTNGEHLGLKKEHGLSFFIEKNGVSYIFDTGQSSAFIDNSFKLGLNPFEIDKIILSHGHYDHSGGTKYFLEQNNTDRNFEFVLHKDFFNLKYAVNGAQSEFLGNDFTSDYINTNNCSIRWISQDIEEIASGVYVISNFNRNDSAERINPRFKLLQNDELVPDYFNDEIMLAIESPKGWVLIVGCAHPGIMNMINTFQERLSGKIHAVIGGTHMVEADILCMDATVDFFNNLDCNVIGVSHCTGKIAEEKFATDKRFFHNSTGTSLIVI